MTLLYQRMLEDLRIRNLAESTQKANLYEVRRLSKHFNRSPAELCPEQLREYLLYLTNRCSKNTVKMAHIS